MPFRYKKDWTKWIILGTGSGWNLAPQDSEYIMIGLNDYVKQERYQTKLDMLFIMDVMDEKPQIVSGFDNLGDIINRINSMKIPLICPYPYVEIPLSQPFPLKECVARFGEPYFTNTICYMIAYALLKGARELQIFGVNQASSEEYSQERGGVEYWLGVANGMNVKVSINGEQSQLMRYKGRHGRGVLYGYAQSYEEIIKSEEKWGEMMVKKLLVPPKKVGRTIRNLARVIR